jgi:hypothetical protein
MRNSTSLSGQSGIYFGNLQIRLALIITISGILVTSSMVLNIDNIQAQTLQEKCIPDSGINVSKSNCFSNAPTSPTYNTTNTNNVRPPPT